MYVRTVPNFQVTEFEIDGFSVVISQYTYAYIYCMCVYMHMNMQCLYPKQGRRKGEGWSPISHQYFMVYIPLIA